MILLIHLQLQMISLEKHSVSRQTSRDTLIIGFGETRPCVSLTFDGDLDILKQ